MQNRKKEGNLKCNLPTKNQYLDCQKYIEK